MPPDPFDLTKLATPLGPPTNRRTVDISSEDFVFPQGFLCQVVGAGDLTYRCLTGDQDETETLAVGGGVYCQGIPIPLQTVRASVTIDSIVVAHW